jgi:hypothetical protein
MRSLTLLSVLCGVAACQPRYDGLRLRLLTGQGQISGDEIELVEGQAITIEVEPISSNPFEDYEKFNLVRLRSVDQTVVLAAPADDVDRFVLVGRGIGTTAIDVEIDGRHVDVLTGRVQPQEVE